MIFHLRDFREYLKVDRAISPEIKLFKGDSKIGIGSQNSACNEVITGGGHHKPLSPSKKPHRIVAR